MIITSIHRTEPAPAPLALRKSKFKLPSRNRPTVKRNEKKLKLVLAKFLKAEAKELAKIAADTMGKSLASDIMAALTGRVDTWGDKLPSRVKPYITAVAVDGGEQTSEALGLMSDEVMALMRTRAKAWSEARSAEMVGRKWVDGELVTNPNARWAITESTRDGLRDLVRNALNEGASPQELADRIQESHLFSPERSEMVARTEMAMADSAGTMESYRATPGVSGKRWLTAGDENVSEECLESEASGTIKLDAGFPPNGVDAPPNHPNCRCVVEPVFEDEM